MKIGIITFHRALNYGAVLQAYALQEYLNTIGIDSEIIDYRSEYIEIFYKQIKENPLKNPKMYLKELIYAPFNTLKRKKFDGFLKKYIKFSKKITTKEELKKINKEYDIFIAGSDQVWNLKWSGFDKTFFLDFAEDEKKYSYAASFGFDKIPQEQEREYYELLSKFKKISVREESGKKIIKDLLHQECEVSLDPTCLISKAKWENIAKKPKEQNYILLYTLEKSKELEDYAEKKSKELNAKIVYIADAIKRKKKYIYRGFLGPDEFVGLFSNARYVVTNSFHGLMFSVIFEKSFCLQYQKKEGAPNSRLIDFLNTYKLTNRIIEAVRIRDSEIDYNFVKYLMEETKRESSNYLLRLKNDIVILPQTKNKCCGCRACEKICPIQAVKMLEDEEGFLYPKIDENKCIKCKKCMQVCAFSQKKLQASPTMPPNTYVGYHKDEKVRMKSRSGGIFVALSDYVLLQGGSVYGAGYTDDFKVVHSRAIDSSERENFCGSKYVQSDTLNTFEEVLEDLKNEKKVLYSGTACQIGGLKSYLRAEKIGNKINNLITVDIVCHGVMSPMVWRDNIKEMQKKIEGKIEKVNFRDKSFGWSSHIESYKGKNERIISDDYTSIFYEHAFLRPSCYNCPYTSVEREADFTLADAWGIKKMYPQWDIEKGISLVLSNTEKGMEIFRQIEKMLVVQSVDIHLFMQPNLEHPTDKPKNRVHMWNLYKKEGFICVANECKKKQNMLKKKNKMKSNIVGVLRKIHLK